MMGLVGMVDTPLARIPAEETSYQRERPPPRAPARLQTAPEDEVLTFVA